MSDEKTASTHDQEVSLPSFCQECPMWVRKDRKDEMFVSDTRTYFAFMLLLEYKGGCLEPVGFCKLSLDLAV